MSMSPGSNQIVSGAGDETLRFWTIWEDKEEESDLKRSQFRWYIFSF